MALDTALISVDLVPFRLARESALQLLTVPKPFTELPALPSGRIDPAVDDSLEDTVRRQLSNVSQAKATYIDQVVTMGDRHRDSRGWSLTVVYYVLLRPDDVPLCDGARWIDIHNGQPCEPLAYDHAQLVGEALERLRSKIQYSALPVHLLPEQFTLSDVQHVFQVLLSKAPPMRSIRNRFLKGNLLIDTDEKRYGSNRPAALYRVNEKQSVQWFDRMFSTVRVE